MRFWQFLRFTAPADLLTLAPAIEQQTLFDGVVLGDHMLFPEALASPYPYSKDGQLLWDPSTPWPDIAVSIAAMSAVTTRLQFSTNVVVLPLRHPIEMARSLATLSAISGNRVALGAGVGWMAEEYQAMGIDFATRGKRYDEMIEVMRLLWAGEMAEYHGRFFDFPRLQLSPSPAGTIPLYLAGGSPAAMRRAARVGDGWITGNLPLDQLETTFGQIRRLLEEAGRADQPFELIAPVGRDLTLIRALRDLGATSIIDLSSRRDIGPDKTEQQKVDYFKRYSDEIIANL